MTVHISSPPPQEMMASTCGSVKNWFTSSPQASGVLLMPMPQSDQQLGPSFSWNPDCPRAGSAWRKPER